MGFGSILESSVSSLAAEFVSVLVELASGFSPLIASSLVLATLITEESAITPATGKLTFSDVVFAALSFSACDSKVLLASLRLGGALADGAVDFGARAIPPTFGVTLILALLIV